MKYLITVLITLTCLPPLLADVIQNGYHSVNREVVFVNLEAFPELSLVAFIQGPTGVPAPYVITNNVPLTKGYKFNTLTVYAISNTLLTSKGGPGNLTFNISNGNVIDPYGGTVIDANPLVYEKIVYQISGYSNANVILKVKQRIQTYNNGSKPVTNNY